MTLGCIDQLYTILYLCHAGYFGEVFQIQNLIRDPKFRFFRVYEKRITRYRPLTYDYVPSPFVRSWMTCSQVRRACEKPSLDSVEDVVLGPAGHGVVKTSAKSSAMASFSLASLNMGRIRTFRLLKFSDTRMVAPLTRNLISTLNRMGV